MATLEKIPLHDALDRTGRLGNGVEAILNEIVALLEKLQSTGKGDQIDLKNLPLAPWERTNLRERLGRGEATIELDIGGITRCIETEFPAVWWVEHLNPGGTVAAEFIEIAEIPHILKYEADEIQLGIANLKKRLATV
jgi:hydrogenase-1 operon protein HyaF